MAGGKDPKDLKDPEGQETLSRRWFFGVLPPAIRAWDQSGTSLSRRSNGDVQTATLDTPFPASLGWPEPEGTHEI